MDMHNNLQMRTYTPSQFEYAIAIASDHGEAFIFFNPTEETGRSSDEHIGELTQFLKRAGDFRCAMECTYTFNGTVAEARSRLDELGFKSSKELESILLSCDCEVVSDDARMGAYYHWD